VEKLAIRDETALTSAQEHYQSALTETSNKVVFVNQVALEVLVKGENGSGDYSTIPGCGNKPTLLKPGAEKICLAFGFVPKYEIEKINLPGGHREYEITCLLYNRDGVYQGSGVGTCTTMESKYRYREAQKKCPECDAEALIINSYGKGEMKGGWFCFGKKGGCGKAFRKDDKAITDQESGRMENTDFADQYNTVKKMSKKRAYVDATITASASGSLFTQDIEDMKFKEGPAPASTPAPKKEVVEAKDAEEDPPPIKEVLDRIFPGGQILPEQGDLQPLDPKVSEAREKSIADHSKKTGANMEAQNAAKDASNIKDGLMWVRTVLDQEYGISEMSDVFMSWLKSMVAKEVLDLCNHEELQMIYKELGNKEGSLHKLIKKA